MMPVLIVAHAPLASALKAVAAHVYAEPEHLVEALDVPPEADVPQVQALARALLDRLDQPEWLVLTDVYGATPCTAMSELAEAPTPGRRLCVVAGVNVPMLWRSLCYADESLDAMATRALGGAVNGVRWVAPEADAPTLPGPPPQ